MAVRKVGFDSDQSHLLCTVTWNVHLATSPEDLHASIRLAALKDLATTPSTLWGILSPLPVYDSGRDEGGRNDEDEIYGAVLGDTLDVTIHI